MVVGSTTNNDARRLRRCKLLRSESTWQRTCFGYTAVMQTGGGSEQIADPSTAAGICRHATAVPGRDGGMRYGALVGV